MNSAKPNTVLDDFYRFLLSAPTAQQVSDYQFPLAMRARMTRLVGRRQQKTISSAEDIELDELIHAVELLTISFDRLLPNQWDNYPILTRLSRRELRIMLTKADPIIFNETLQFLQDDPRTMGSGYAKQVMWKYIKRYDLNADQLAILEATALNYLKRRSTIEFKYMFQTMARIASSSFWAKVEQASQSDVPTTGLNAACMLPYSRGVEAGEQFRLIYQQEQFQKRWAAAKASTTVHMKMDEFIALLHTAEFWGNCQTISQSIKPSDLPIIYYNPTYDSEVASLDYRYCRAQLVIPKLRELLFSEYGPWQFDVKEIELYAIFVLKKIGTPAAVTTLLEFMEKRIDHKFESPSKSIISSAVYKALAYIGTPEALQAIHTRQQIELSQSEGVHP